MDQPYKESVITIGVTLDAQKVPEAIRWSATDSTAEQMQAAKAMLLNFWDGEDKAALRIDLWTKEMMIDEMVDFYYQTFIGMAQSLERATGQKELVADLEAFAKNFMKKFQQSQQQQNA
ncbi:MAG: gliding motility protein GldC [Chitinophagaceae bacterium]|nr:gliding motility protein GldC [Chitinophagaceae bacterium]